MISRTATGKKRSDELASGQRARSIHRTDGSCGRRAWNGCLPVCPGGTVLTRTASRGSTCRAAPRIRLHHGGEAQHADASDTKAGASLSSEPRRHRAALTRPASSKLQEGPPSSKKKKDEEAQSLMPTGHRRHQNRRASMPFSGI